MKARYLKSVVLEELRQSISKNLDNYRRGSFPHLIRDSFKYFEGRFEVDDAALASLRIADDGGAREEENCATCYRALTGLTPYEARDERFWAYLTHTHLLDYTRSRWPIPEEDDAAIGHIATHFFAKDKREIERGNAASRLWWMAHLCHRIQGLSLEDSLTVLLYRSDVRANIIERPTASQSTEVFSAIMKKLHASYMSEKKLFDRTKFRFLMVRINSIGGVKLLDCMSERQLSDLIGTVIERDLAMQII